MGDSTSWRGSRFVVKEVKDRDQDLDVERFDPGAAAPAWTLHLKGLIGSYYCWVHGEFWPLRDYLMLTTYGLHVKGGSDGDFSIHRISYEGQRLWSRDGEFSLLRSNEKGFLLTRRPGMRSHPLNNPVLELHLLDPETGQSKEVQKINAPEEVFSLPGSSKYLEDVSAALTQEAGREVVLLTLPYANGKNPTYTFLYELPPSLRA